MEIIFAVLLILLLLAIIGPPILLTIVNSRNLFAKKPYLPVTTDILIFLLGPLLTWLLFAIWNSLFSNEMQNLVIFPQPLFNYPVFIILAFIAIAGYALLRIKRTSLSPPAIIICIGSLFIGCSLSIIWIIQIINSNFIDLLDVSVSISLCLFPLNYIISTISLIRKIENERSASSSGSLSE